VDSLRPGTLRVLSWNIHKSSHADLPADLARHAAENDVLLLQEAVHSAPVLEVLEHEGHFWQMVGAFAFRGLQRGVLVATRTVPVTGRALRTYEPLFPLPKSAIVTRYPLAGRREQLAVANLHGINFSLGMGRFREQLADIAAELADHDGPVIFGGDFNTWSQRRHEALGRVTDQLGLKTVKPDPDDRLLAFGRHLDHLFVRGFSVVSARCCKVESSDHSPIQVSLVVQAAKG